MPLVFVSLSQTFTDKIKDYGFEAYTMRIEEFVSKTQETYYVSPANSLCFMDGGIDYALSRIVFPGIEYEVKEQVKKLNRQNLLGRFYLPIGSSLIVEKGSNALIVAPTMLLPQDVSATKNAYYATMAVLYNILVNQKKSLETTAIVFTSLCCGYGKMKEADSIQQILDGIRDYTKYTPTVVNSSLILHEPNLQEQPKLYQNTEWFSIHPKDIQG
jgi:O-acetyl-ADP-ribose deacetylase (regulator of RNase III)